MFSSALIAATGCKELVEYFKCLQHARGEHWHSNGAVRGALLFFPDMSSHLQSETQTSVELTCTGSMFTGCSKFVCKYNVDSSEIW